MSLIPKITVSNQDKDLYASVMVQDATGAYNSTTNPGGYGAPNPGTGAVQRTLLREEYLGDATPKDWEAVTNLATLGGAFQWVHGFREGVTRIGYLVVVSGGSGLSILMGNYNFTLPAADTLLVGATHVEIAGVLYEIDKGKPLTSSGGYFSTPSATDQLNVAYNVGYSGYVYTLWNFQGEAALMKDIASSACTSLECGKEQFDSLMARYRFYLGAQYNFNLAIYSKAHNQAIALSPSFTTSKCASC